MENLKIKLAPALKIRAEKFGAILFDKTREQYFVVDGVGRDILQCLQETDSIKEVLSRLTDLYEAPAEVIKRDLEIFLNELKVAKLVVD